jgi:hypothetical protein
MENLSHKERRDFGISKTSRVCEFEVGKTRIEELTSMEALCPPFSF